jgi:GTPase SAR1 family protein
VSSETTKVPNPTASKGDKSQERITIIDLSGSKRFRQQSWPNYYKKIHGLIFVIDASEKKSISENQDTLEELLEHDDLKDKPILM